MYKRLRDMREDKDLKQRELAEMLNVSQTTYSRYESGELDIPSAALIKLADFYNVSVDDILGRPDKETEKTRTIVRVCIFIFSLKACGRYPAPCRSLP